MADFDSVYVFPVYSVMPTEAEEKEDPALWDIWDAYAHFGYRVCSSWLFGIR